MVYPVVRGEDSVLEVVSLMPAPKRYKMDYLSDRFVVKIVLTFSKTETE